MLGNSSPVRSGQLLADSRIQARQRRRAGKAFQRPLSEHNVRVYERLRTWLDAQTRPLLFDTGCGIGESSLQLARRFPDCAVLGADKSLQRLRQRGISEAQPLAVVDRCCFVLLDLVDLWRLLAADGRHFARLYLYYPNPWPKPAHRLRRWPLHPIWPTLLSLAPELELRSNWSVLAIEAEQALRAEGWLAERSVLPAQLEPATPFEAKYQASGHPLWQVLGRQPASRERPGDRSG
ncbi:MAG: hypothetical protein KDI48_09245 [Xanthomonadales bacterium]|nr:hypothetical protein [Xanthomonadales bacterium]